jgi:hypothetical protein
MPVCTAEVIEFAELSGTVGENTEARREKSTDERRYAQMKTKIFA